MVKKKYEPLVSVSVKTKQVLGFRPFPWENRSLPHAVTRAALRVVGCPAEPENNYQIGEPKLPEMPAKVKKEFERLRNVILESDGLKRAAYGLQTASAPLFPGGRAFNDIIPQRFLIACKRALNGAYQSLDDQHAQSAGMSLQDTDMEKSVRSQQAEKRTRDNRRYDPVTGQGKTVTAYTNG